MTISVPKIGDIEVKDITYKQSRELHRLNVKTFWGKEDNAEKIEPDKYYDLLDKVQELSGLKDADLKKYSMMEVDAILQAVLMEYTGLSPKD